MGNLDKYSYAFSDSSISNTVKRILEDQVFLNALKLANPAFFDYIQQCFSSDNHNYSKKALYTLIKFYSRFATRSTPFGGYACISLANWGTNTNFKLETSVNGILQPDTQWLYKVVRILEDDSKILSYLNVKSNKNIYSRLDRCVNPYISNCGATVNRSVNITIRRTSLLDQVLKYAKEGVCFENLVAHIQSVTGSDISQVTTYLKELLQNEFLITELRVLATTEDPLKNIIALLSKMELDIPNTELLHKLTYIHDTLEKPDSIQSAIFNAYLSNVIDVMASIVKSDNYIYSYYRRESEKCHIGFNVRKELNQLNKLFSYFSTVDTETQLVRDFKRFFVERYGQYCAVPLTILLEQYEYHDLSTPNDRVNSYLDNLIMDAVKQGKRQISLSDFDLLRIAPHGKIQLPPSPSFEVCCSINAESYDAINNNQFEILIGPNIGANKLNCHYSRFNRSYSKLEKEELYNNYRVLEEVISDNYRTINIFELPRNTRVQNICYSLPFYESLDFSLYSDSDISINDIYVCYDEINERLYLYSQKHDAVVKFISDNMLNPVASNFIGRLLKDISASMEFHYINALTLFRSSTLKYIPKIMYSRIVLMPETWRIAKDDFDLRTIHTFHKTLKDYIAKWNIPTLIYLSERDNRILLDLSNEIFIDLLFAEVKKRGVVTLTSEFSTEPWLEDDCAKHYANEVVFSFVYEKQIQQKYPSIPKKYYTKSKVYLPSNSSWLYYKVYIKSDNINEFFVRHMIFFKSAALKSNAQLFFIRYSDPNFHVRMRIKCDDEEIKRKIQKEIEDYMYPLIECGFIISINLSMYEREIERYGNEDTIQFAENYFCDDSLYCIDLLQKNENEVFRMCVRDALIIMRTFYPDTRTLYSIIGKYNIDVKRFSKEFYTNVASYIELDDSSSEMLLWEKSIKKYHSKITDNLQSLCNTVEDIMFSLVHMHCNRLSGKRDFEEAVLSATKLIIKYKKNRQEKGE